MEIYADGSGWNGKKSKYCVCDEFGNVTIEVLNSKKTNNEMEYEAVICALRRASDGDIIYSDSKLVVNQISGSWKIKNKNLFTLCQTAKQIKKNKNVEIIWLPRENNLAGHILEGD
jgi:ribonuclease HI